MTGRITNTMAQRRIGVCMLSAKFYATSDMGGGLEQSARRLIAYLVQAGHQVFVLTRNYDGLPHREVIDGAVVERFPVWGRSPALASLSYLAQSLWWLIQHRRQYDLIHGHQSYAPAVIGGLAKLLLRKPVMIKISTADVFSERRQLEHLPLFTVRRFLLRRIDRFVAVNPAASAEFADLGIPAAAFIHIPNGVPVPMENAFDPAAKRAARRRLEWPTGRAAVFVGRLSAEKNLDVLIQSWAEVIRTYPDAHLVLVGDGGTFRNVETELRRQVQALGLADHVHFAGRVSHVQDFLVAADVFVLPSQTEGMSNALLEAMASGLAVVATRVPGNRQLIEDGENGLLVDPGRADVLASAVIRVFGSSKEAERLGRAARRTVEERFTMRQVGRAYLELYGQLLNGRQRN